MSNEDTTDVIPVTVAVIAVGLFFYAAYHFIPWYLAALKYAVHWID